MRCPLNHCTGRNSVPIVLALLSWCIPAFAFNAHQPFDISADLIDFVDASEQITAEGHVVVVQTSSTLSADFLRYDRVHQRLQARGHVILREKDSLLAGDVMDYDLMSEKGTTSNAIGYGSPWLFQGANWEKDKDYYAGRQTAFTSCELIDPHYHLRSSRVHLVPDRLFWAWNNIAYADQVPVMYSPFVYKYLDKRRVTFQAQPGNDSANGTFAKTTTTMRFTDDVYDKILFDHYDIAGNGVGNELTYQSPGKLKGSLFGYYIDPKGNPEQVGSPRAPQYTIRSYHWQQLSPTISLQSNVNLRKNVSFNNQYFAQDINQSVNDIISSVALTRSKEKTSQRLVVENLQSPDPGDNGLFAETHVQKAALPRFDFTLFQIPLWNEGTQQAPGAAASTSTALAPSTTTVLAAPPGKHIGPVMFNMNSTIGNTYLRQDEKIHTHMDHSFTLTESIPLSRKWNLTAAVVPQLHWQDKRDPAPRPPAGSTTTVIPTGLFRGFQGRAGTNETLRYRPFSSLTLDQTYNLTARLAPNGTALDRKLADGGIETHHLNWLAYLRPSRALLFRSYSGYDLRRLADEDPNAYRQRRVDPWTTEMTLTPLRSTVEYFARYQLNYHPIRTSLWEASARYRGMYRTIMETSLLYNRGQAGVLTWNNTLGFYLSPGWRVDTSLNSFVPASSLEKATRQSSSFGSEFIVKRDMHCWQAQFIYRNRPPYSREYSILFDLKFGPKSAKDIADKDLEAQFYPWRAGAWAR
ncbi:MAG: hypothetical protein WC859_02180 [Elusimicrobiota bacterium]|jgi:lipopolysaccharide export system protein LptA